MLLRSKLIRRALVATSVLAFAALLLAPIAFADPGVLRQIDVGRAFDAGMPAHDSGVISRIPPDPAPLSSRGQWIFDLRYSKGDPSLLGVHRIDLNAPESTPRAMGRFALELFEGPVLMERVRFDFPMLGAGETTFGGMAAPISFEAGLTTRIGVMFPVTWHGTRLELWDRATGRRWALPWPPADTRALPDAAAPNVVQNDGGGGGG